VAAVPTRPADQDFKQSYAISRTQDPAETATHLAALPLGPLRESRLPPRHNTPDAGKRHPCPALGENPGQFRDQTPGYFASRGGSENPEGDPGEKTGGGSGVWKWEMLGILLHAHGRGWNPYHRGACVGRGSGGRGSSHDRRQLVQRVGSASVVAPSPGDEGACRGLEHHAAPQHRAAPLY
jgi:hypothetical protein